MVFSSSIFLVYFLPVFLLVYFMADRRYKNAVLLVASILFYSWGGPKFIFAILGTTTLDFYLVRTMSSASNERKRKLFLVLSLVLNVGMLFYFKYCNFFVENFNNVLGALGKEKTEWVEIVLPIGISFYTFESLTYVVDVYRRLHKPLENFWQYQLYILLFPKLIAGPIIRYHEISDQVADRSANDTPDNKLAGFMRFAIGLAKKVLIANVMAAKADEIFALPDDQLYATTAWIGMIAYTFQIYFDFSGYSDMAIGIGRMIGFKFPENFDNPYTSASITEFWKRWHMTLGNWMRNYLYIPLGGNRVSKRKMYFNLWLVFLLSGFWHGAAWSYILWGLYHGFFLVMERAFLLKFYEKTGRFLATVITFLIVALGWVFFKLDYDVSAAFRYISRLVVFSGETPYLFWNTKFLVIAVVAALFAFSTTTSAGRKLQQVFYYSERIDVSRTLSYTLISALLFIISLAAVTSSSFNPFIYFRF